MTQQQKQPSMRGAPAQRAAQAAAVPADESPLQRISRQLHDRFPHRLIKRFVMPSKVRECREVFIVELTSRDEVQAAIMAEQSMSQLERLSYRLSGEAQNREQLRVAIVALGEMKSGEVLYRQVNHDGVPLGEIDNWSQSAWAALYAYNGTVNGIPIDELKSGIEASCAIGAFAVPTNAAPNSGTTGQ